jgi:hypothetical protein
MEIVFPAANEPVISVAGTGAEKAAKQKNAVGVFVCQPRFRLHFATIVATVHETILLPVYRLEP